MFDYWAITIELEAYKNRSDWNGIEVSYAQMISICWFHRPET